MVRIVFFSLFAATEAVSCSSDDQAAIQALDDQTFGDKSNKCGKQALGLSGIDHGKFKSCMTTEVGISDSCGECYATTADYGFKNCKAACLLGWCKEGCLSCTAPAQTDLPACTGIPTGTPTPCLETSAVKCSADDQAAIQGLDDQTFGDKSNKCGKQALGLSGIDHGKFKSCMTTEVGISDSCGDCYATTADYGFKNCKAACLLGWCKEGCLTCTAPAQTDLPACTGIPAGTPTPCLETVSTGSCSAADQAALSDSATVGAAGSKCGLKAFGLKFDHGKFNDCFTAELGVSGDCSECYAANGEYASKNCKAACLLGWCKQGCLDCSTAAAPKAALDSCTGFTSGTADPCLEEVSTGACSADDQANLADASTVGDKQDKCGKSALKLTGIDHDGFVSCVQSELSISASCSECYYTVADYGFKNCKAACLLGWCKSGCLSCTQPAQDDLSGCTGFQPSTASPCMDKFLA